MMIVIIELLLFLFDFDGSQGFITDNSSFRASSFHCAPRPGKVKVKLKLIKCSMYALNLSGLHIVIMLSQFSMEIAVFKGRNLRIVVYMQIFSILYGRADLPLPMGECAPAWGKLAHLESIQKTNIYSKLY